MGIVFGNGLIGQQIFLNWIGEFSNRDEFDAIRVSVIEGDIAGMKSGYSVHLSADRLNLLAHATSVGAVITEGDQWTLRSLICRMHPTPGISVMLPQFKREFAKHGEYLLAPVIARDGQLWFEVELGIIKRTIYFREVGEIGEDDDADAVVVKASGQAKS
jgi:hypothetical protein